jgi:predicted NAD/FAD-dependent oxidoreductase
LPQAGGITLHAQHRVDRLERRGALWHVHGARADGGAGAAAAETPFELSAPLLLVTAPAPQSAALLAAHRPEWASRARSVPMQPTWTLMAVADGVDAERLPPWGLARPQRGPLAWVLRQDSRPGRAPLPGAVAFVAHATVDWSITHLEAEPERVQALLLEALTAWTGPQPWRHVMVHRWRYATVERAAAQQPGLGLFDASNGLAVAGDWLGGGGVEGAWLSGRAMAAALRDLGGPAP